MAKRERSNISDAAQRYITRLKARNNRIVWLAIGACVALFLVAAIITGIVWLNQEEPDDGKILSNVYIAGVNLGGMTQEEATLALRLTIGDSLTTQDMVVSLPDDELILSPADTQAFVNIDDLVTAAYQYGRSGTKLENKITRANSENHNHVIALLDHMYLDLGYVRKAVEEFCQGYSSTMVQSTVVLRGTRPDYHTLVSDGISPNSVKHQTLEITIGTPQFVLEADALYDAVLDAYSTFRLSFTYDAPTALEPDPLDAQALFDTYCTLPEDATMDSKTFIITPEIYGYGFDVAELSRLIYRAEYGETVIISFNFLYPEITEEDLNRNYFQNLLAHYVSEGDGTKDANRDTNLKLACEAINGIIIKPGEAFNFNLILGPRTTNLGYKSAPTYSGSSTNTVGGGISQISSTLRYCAMMAGLRIDEYHTHAYAVPYTPLGTDASISYGTENLVFTNTTSDPIQIYTYAENGTVTVSIVGTEERSYILSIESVVVEELLPETVYQYMTENNVFGYKDGHELQSGFAGYIVEIHYHMYHPETGEELYTEMLETYTYNRRNQIIVRIENGEDMMDPSEQGLT